MAMSEKTRRNYPRFSQYVLKKLREHGNKFSMADLDMRFVPYFESESRIKVKPKYGDEITGGRLETCVPPDPPEQLSREFRYARTR